MARGTALSAGGRGRLAQRESASFTPRRSLVRSQYRPPKQPQLLGGSSGRLGLSCSVVLGAFGPWPFGCRPSAAQAVVPVAAAVATCFRRPPPRAHLTGQGLR